jgi:hypothetical protein
MRFIARGRGPLSRARECRFIATSRGARNPRVGVSIPPWPLSQVRCSLTESALTISGRPLSSRE